MTDDQTAASLADMQNVNTLLGGEGTKFDQAIDSFPLCCPSRATNLTGQYAHNHGVLHNAPPFGGFIQLDGTNTLPVWLQDAGYRTMHVGRYLNGYEAKYGIPPGWTDWVGLPHSAAFNYFAWKAFDHGVVKNYPDAAHPGEYLTDFETREGVELIDEASPGDRPFYLSLWYTAPHRGAPRDPDDPRRPGTPSPRRATATPTPACGCRARRASTRGTCTTSRRWWPTGRACRPSSWPASRRTGARRSSRSWRSTRASPRSSRRCAATASSTTR